MEDQGNDNNLDSSGLEDSLVAGLEQHDESIEQPVEEAVSPSAEESQEGIASDESEQAKPDEPDVSVSEPDPIGDLLAGKFSNVSDLESGYKNIQSLGSRVSQENSTLRTRELELENRVRDLEAQRDEKQPTLSEQSAEVDWDFRKSFEEDPEATVRRFMTEQTDQTRRAMQHEISQTQAMERIQGELIRANPDFANPESGVMNIFSQFMHTLNNNPRDPQIIAGLAKAAEVLDMRGMDNKVSEQIGISKGIRHQKQKQMAHTVTSNAKATGKSKPKLSGDVAELAAAVERDMPGLDLTETLGE